MLSRGFHCVKDRTDWRPRYQETKFWHSTDCWTKLNWRLDWAKEGFSTHLKPLVKVSVTTVLDCTRLEKKEKNSSTTKCKSVILTQEMNFSDNQTVAGDSSDFQSPYYKEAQWARILRLALYVLYRLCRCSRQSDSMPCNNLSAADAHYYQLLCKKFRHSWFGHPAYFFSVWDREGERPVSLTTGGISKSVRLSLVGFVFWRVGLVDHSHRCWSSESHSPRSPSQARFHRVQVSVFDGRLCLCSDHFGATIHGHGFLRLQARFLYKITDCAQRWPNEEGGDEMRKVYFMSLTVFCYILPLTIVVGTFHSISRKLRASSKFNRTIREDYGKIDEQRHRKRLRERQNSKVKKLLIPVVIAFAVTMLPLNVFRLVVLYWKEITQQKYLWIYFNICVFSSSLIHW